jgi:hypothetical protein
MKIDLYPLAIREPPQPEFTDPTAMLELLGLTGENARQASLRMTNRAPVSEIAHFHDGLASCAMISMGFL